MMTKALVIGLVKLKLSRKERKSLFQKRQNHKKLNHYHKKLLGNQETQKNHKK
jgi:hypothetical protein